MVAADGTWSISGLASNTAVGSGSNTFSARQVDTLGNSSVLSNLWTVSALGGNQLMVNGDFSEGNTGFTTIGVNFTTNMNHGSAANQYAVLNNPPSLGTAVLGTIRPEVTTSNPNLKWTNSYNQTSNYNPVYLNNQVVYGGNPNGKMSGNVLEINLGSNGTFWQQNVQVEAGKTYTFEFDYQTNSWGSTPLTAIVDGTSISFTSGWFETGHFKATYTATESKTITLSMYANNAGNAESGASNGDAKLDNFSFTTNTVAADNSLQAGGSLPFTSGADGASTAIAYSGGAADMLGGNDVLNVPSTVQSLLSAGGFIDGGAGVDRLTLAVGSVLDLSAIAGNQTVKPIQEVEIFQLQGNSSLTLRANDVMSLGAANLTGFNFGSTTGGAASTSSTNKVQMVVLGTTTDALNLNALAIDGVTTNGILGNTGLAGEWQYMGTTVIGGVTYKVYDHSTTQAQVLTDMTASTESAVVSFSSMTKDSSLQTATADWITADSSAGRLVSGTLAAPLGGHTLQVYANGVLVDSSLVSISADGRSWAFTDINGYTGNWTYRADVLSGGTVIGSATQVVTTDLIELAPVITAVTDSASASIAHSGSTSNTLSAVSGTGNAGSTIYLYDNSGTNLVGTTTVAANGTWTVTGLATNTAVGSGSNSFSARQMDSMGNASVLSNVWTVNAAANVLDNSDFSNGLTGWTTGANRFSTTGYEAFFNNTANHAGTLPASVYGASTSTTGGTPFTTTSGVNSASGTISISNSFANGVFGNPNGAFSGSVFAFNNHSGNFVMLSQKINVVSGQTYSFSFDYTSWSGADLRFVIGNSFVNFAPWDAANSLGRVTGTFTATTTGLIDLQFVSTNQSDFNMDNLRFSPASLPADGTLVAGGTPPFTAGSDGVAGNSDGGNPSVSTYSGGITDLLAGNDVIAASANIQALLDAQGNLINGGAGVDTLRLTAGTVLNLPQVVSNQTAPAIQRVEVLQMQGSSALILSANDVLSLGGSNASTMSAYTFNTTAQTADGAVAASGTAVSANKVQMVVRGTSSDTLVLDTLQTDGVTTNGVLGNSGLAGGWSYMGVATTSAGTFKVYNQSTTGAQVLVDLAVNVAMENTATVTKTASFSSMTKDSSTATAHADWLTNDASAGRQVSGTVSTALANDEQVQIFANGVAMGYATLNAARTAWTFTDTSGYNANWFYTAQVVNAGTGLGGAVALQQVTLDSTESAPVITAVTDSASTSIANNGTTYYAVSTVSGTGHAGSTIYLYDNASSNLVGTTTVGSNGTWSVTNLTSNLALGKGSNAFYARQVDAAGNASVLSNAWTVSNSNSGNQLENGDLSLGIAGAPAALTYSPGVTHNQLYSSNGASYTIFSTTPTQSNFALTASFNYGTTAGNTTAMTYQIRYNQTGSQTLNPDGLFKGQYFGFNSQSSAYGNFWSDTVDVVAGQTYNFSIDYINWNKNVRLYIGDAYVGLWGNAVGDGSTAGSSVLYASGWGTYTATTTGTITIALNNFSGPVDFQFDNLYFGKAAIPTDGTLSAGANPPFTANADGTSSAITYTGGAADMLGGNDVLNIGTNAQNLLATSTNFINGNTGIDTLKLAANTTLNLVTLTNNQTVKPIQQVEVFELQGGSTLTLSANNVLSLGGSNASTMAAYSFGSTAQHAFGATAATGSTSSTGKVQFVVNGTATDTVTLTGLQLDGLGGNTGLAGQWDYKGTTSITVGGFTTVYRVYNHSTSEAQVLIDHGIANRSVSISAAEIGGTSSTEGFDLLQSTTVTGSNALTTSSGAWTISMESTNGTALSNSTNTLWLGYGSGITGSAVGDLASGSEDGVLFWLENGQGTPGRITTFTPTNPQPFDRLSFYYTDVNGPTDANKIEFYDAAGQLVHSANMNLLGGSTTPHLFSLTLPTGVTATSFKIHMVRQDQWAIDDMTTSLNGTANLISGAGSMDRTPLLKGVYQGTLLAGDEIRVYDGTTLLGTATIDTVNKTWSYQVSSDAVVGNRTYSASLFNATEGLIDTSTNFTVNVLASPLVIDLNGDGVQTTSLADGVQFDLLGNGSLLNTAWVDRHDGLLVLDLNGDGIVNSGAELLGSGTRLADGSLARDGWQALAQYDTNADGQIDAQDAVFAQLGVWVDANTDGVTDAGELRSLAEAGIQSIGLQRDASQTTQNGNILDGLAEVAFADGRTTQMTDVWFNVEQPNQESQGAGQQADALQHASDAALQVLLDQQMIQLQTALWEQEAQKYL